VRGRYTQATCLATLRKVEGRSIFLATRNATIAVAKWGVTREFFLATCNATFVALQVARKIASCKMALREAAYFRITSSVFSCCFYFEIGPKNLITLFSFSNLRYRKLEISSVTS